MFSLETEHAVDSRRSCDIDPGHVAPLTCWSVAMRLGLGSLVLWLGVGCGHGKQVLSTDSGAAGTGDSGGDSSSCADSLVSFDFEEDEQGFWSEETDDGFDDPWEHGTPDADDCHSGESCWATGMDGEYGACEAGALLSPVLDLTACADQDLTLSFWHRYQLEEESSDTWWDGAKVQVSADGGESWQEVDPSEEYTGVVEGNFSECDDESEFDGEEAWSGAGDGWEEVTISLDSDVLTAEFQVRFWFVSDRAAEDEGWYVDDVALAE